MIGTKCCSAKSRWSYAPIERQAAPDRRRVTLDARRRTRSGFAWACAIGAVVCGPLAAHPVLTLEPLAGSRVTLLLGPVEGSESIHQLAGIGDLNGDGRADLALGAPFADHAGADSGSVYVLFGRVGGFPASVDLSTLDGSTGFRLDGAAAGDAAGTSVAAAGDVNGDGRDDLIVGAPSATGAFSGSGRSYVLFGRSSFAPTIGLGALSGADGFSISGANTADRSGFRVAGAGDFNADGIDDLVIGAPNADPAGLESGAAYIVFGRSGAPGFGAGLSLAQLDGSNGVRFAGSAANQFTGSAVAGLGDFNGDGIADVLVGAEGLGGFAGGAYVVFGRTGPFSASVSLAMLDGRDGFRADGAAAFEFAGRAVGGGRDVDGDGLNEAVIGAPRSNSNGGDAGTSYVLRGRSSPLPGTVALGSLAPPTGFRLIGAVAYDFSAGAVALADDVNGDGIDDVLVGASGFDAPGAQDGGAGFLVFGRSGGWPAMTALGSLDGRSGVRLQSNVASRNAGSSVAGLGDVDGDGLPDFALGGAARDTSGDQARATSFLVYGNAAPLSRPPRRVTAAPVLEDAIGPPGLGVLASFAALYLDAQAMAGIGITATPPASDGSWQFRVAAGDAWAPLPPTLSETAALVLGNDSQLRFVPAPDFFGSAPALGVRLWDGIGGHAPGTPRNIASSIGSLGGFSRAAEAVTLVVPVLAVNDAPSFTLGGAVVVPEDAGPQAIDAHASAISAGPANESGQALRFELTTLPAPAPPAFALAPAIASDTGRLTFAAAADAFGAVALRVVLADDGGTAHGGVDRSAPREFTLTVLPVNDAPSFIASNPPSVIASAGPVTLTGWATFSPGPANEAEQLASYHVTRVSNPALFAIPPAVAPDGTLRYAPAPGTAGTAQVDVVVQDSGGTANGGVDTSGTRSFLFTILASPDGLFADGFEGD